MTDSLAEKRWGTSKTGRCYLRMDKSDEYRRNAAEAQAWADKAKSENDRAAWLRVAQGWLSLIRPRPRTASEKFEAEVQAQGTHQDDSIESH